jgi:MFS family permease
MIAQGITPSFWGPLADTIGRRQVLIYTMLLYIVANIGLGCSQNSGALLTFRFFQAAGSSSTISLGAGVVADIADSSERGGYLGYFSGGTYAFHFRTCIMISDLVLKHCFFSPPV